MDIITDYHNNQLKPTIAAITGDMSDIQDDIDEIKERMGLNEEVTENAV
ncbi:MAG: hypothetical protein IJH36_03060 [Clostridia bacterium]|nr:hypothetical protein [Clostridia bacterium]MBQ3462081.1 hypothetical protein [Clostridia bacterium]MBQ9599407.1 hypothetical protein [Clostridia bacterium]MBR0471005.1 hypothetical protein [Clostridia bacterium]